MKAIRSGKYLGPVGAVAGLGAIPLSYERRSVPVDALVVRAGTRGKLKGLAGLGGLWDTCEDAAGATETTSGMWSLEAETDDGETERTTAGDINYYSRITGTLCEAANVSSPEADGSWSGSEQPKLTYSSRTSSSGSGSRTPSGSGSGSKSLISGIPNQTLAVGAVGLLGAVGLIWYLRR